MIGRGLTIVSGALLVIAAVFLWRNNLSAAFVTAALGACAWFLSYRVELKKKIQDNEAHDENSGEEIDDQ